jgi:hypothetical protein
LSDAHHRLSNGKGEKAMASKQSNLKIVQQQTEAELERKKRWSDEYDRWEKS